MPFLGCAPSDFCARARYRTLPLAMFCMALAVSLRAQVSASSTGGADAAEGSVEWSLAHLRHPDSKVRAQCAAILLKVGPTALADILPRLGVQKTRVQLLRVISDMGPAASVELVRLTEDPALGAAAADALALVARRDFPAIIPGLAGCVKKHPELRASCGQALARASGPKASGSLSAMLPLVSDQDPAIRAYALLALAQIGPAAGRARPFALKALGDGVASVRVAAARLLGSLVRSTAEVRAALKAASEDADREAALAARDALKALSKGRAVSARRGGSR